MQDIAKHLEVKRRKSTMKRINSIKKDFFRGQELACKYLIKRVKEIEEVQELTGIIVEHIELNKRLLKINSLREYAEGKIELYKKVADYLQDQRQEDQKERRQTAG